MPRKEEQNQIMRQESERKILSTAIKEFAKKGFAATKTNELVKQIGISQGLLYHYYPTKQALYNEAIEFCITSTAEYMQKLDDMEGSADKKIATCTRYIFDQIEHQPVLLYQFMLMIQISLEPGYTDILNRYEEAPVSILEKYIRQGQKEGTVVDGDSHTLSILYWATIKGICIHKISENKVYPTPEAKMLDRILLK